MEANVQNGSAHHSNGSSNGGSFSDKLKQPIQELKEKLHGTHLHNAKIHLIHQK